MVHLLSSSFTICTIAIETINYRKGCIEIYPTLIRTNRLILLLDEVRYIGNALLILTVVHPAFGFGVTLFQQKNNILINIRWKKWNAEDEVGYNYVYLLIFKTWTI